MRCCNVIETRSRAVFASLNDPNLYQHSPKSTSLQPDFRSPPISKSRRNRQFQGKTSVKRSFLVDQKIKKPLIKILHHFDGVWEVWGGGRSGHLQGSSQVLNGYPTPAKMSRNIFAYFSVSEHSASFSLLYINIPILVAALGPPPFTDCSVTYSFFTPSFISFIPPRPCSGCILAVVAIFNICTVPRRP